jgi:hypothetical protein
MGSELTSRTPFRIDSILGIVEQRAPTTARHSLAPARVD